MKLKYPKITLERIQNVWDKLGGEGGVDKFLNGEIVIQQCVVHNPILHCISDGKELIIPACDGSHTLVKAREVFKAHIDPDFKNYGLDKPGEPTKEIGVVVHEMEKNATFTQMFGSLGNLDKRCFTQHQIEIFCEVHPEWLCVNGYWTFFLTKRKWKKPATVGNLFVARVSVHSDGMDADAYRFEDDLEWNADSRHRLVVPKLET